MKRSFIHILGILLCLSLLCGSFTLCVHAETPPSGDPSVGDAIVAEEYFGNSTDMGIFLRNKLKIRQDKIAVGYLGATDPNTLPGPVLASALQHTGVSTEGDYLRFQMDALQAQVDGYEGEDYTGTPQYDYAFFYEPVYYTTAAQETQVSNAVSQVLTNLDLQDSSDYEKIRGIHNYLYQTVRYASQGNGLQRTAYGALINKNASGQGYAVAFYRLALELGLDCRVISGKYYGSTHYWNIVKLGGKYYNLDSSGNTNMYLLKTNASFTGYTRDSQYATSSFNAAYPMATADYASAVPNGWYLQGGKWYYGKNGSNVTGWLQLGSTWYYFNSSGIMQTGWLQTGGVWYYFKASGAMATGWLQLGSTWYYLKPSGAMATGWLQLGSTWYYLKPSGAMATGWLHQGSVWYYLYPSGAMATGWLQTGGVWYYFKSSGVMATGTVKIGNTTYRFSGSGAWIP